MKRQVTVLVAAALALSLAACAGSTDGTQSTAPSTATQANSGRTPGQVDGGEKPACPEEVGLSPRRVGPVSSDTAYVPRIAFAAGAEGKSDVYVANADGSALTNLTNNQLSESSVAWSPDGSRIAFDAFSTDNPCGVYSVNTDGSGLRKLSGAPALDVEWSPEGSLVGIMTATDRDSVYLISVIGAERDYLETRLFPATEFHLAWSPDGSRIAFTSSSDGFQYDIYVVNADGSGLLNLTNDAAVDGEPTWSPDGSQIAYESLEIDPEGSGGIYKIDVHGRNRTRLTNDSSDLFPAWSPDGARITFTRSFNELYSVGADGSNEVRLAQFEGMPFGSTSWSHDGTQVAIVVHQNVDNTGTSGVFVVNADGTGLTNLTAHANLYPFDVAWSPKP